MKGGGETGTPGGGDDGEIVRLLVCGGHQVHVKPRRVNPAHERIRKAGRMISVFGRQCGWVNGSARAPQTPQRKW